MTVFKNLFKTLISETTTIDDVEIVNALSWEVFIRVTSRRGGKFKIDFKKLLRVTGITTLSL